MTRTAEIANQMPSERPARLPIIQSHHSSAWVALMAVPIPHIARAVTVPIKQKKVVPAMNRTEKGYPVFRG